MPTGRASAQSNSNRNRFRDMIQPPVGYARGCQAPASRGIRAIRRTVLRLDRGDADCVGWWDGWEPTGADEAEMLFRLATSVKHGVT